MGADSIKSPRKRSLDTKGFFFFNMVLFISVCTRPCPSDVNGGKVEGACVTGKEGNTGPYFVVLEGILSL